MFVCSYVAYQAHAPYCHLWPVWLYHIFVFPRYTGITNGKIFRNNAEGIRSGTEKSEVILRDEGAHVS